MTHEKGLYTTAAIRYHLRKVESGYETRVSRSSNILLLYLQMYRAV